MKELIKIEDLYKDLDAVHKQNELNKLLNCEPKAEWIKINELTGSRHLPIQIVESLLTSIFTRWWVEIKEVTQLVNSVSVTVRLYVIDPLSKETMWQDGVGAVPFTVAKGFLATDFEGIELLSVQTAVPMAKSYAIKDAAECFGRIFGKDLNRKDTININPAIAKKQRPSKFATMNAPDGQQ